MIKGLWRHFLLTLRLNFRSGRAIVYGYIMPILFLVGFGTVFRTGEPRLLYEIGQIFTITILGSACLGMPTALVAEREGAGGAGANATTGGIGGGNAAGGAGGAGTPGGGAGGRGGGGFLGSAADPGSAPGGGGGGGGTSTNPGAGASGAVWVAI